MWVHLFPSRTQKLSTSAPTILGGRLPGKIGNANMNLTASAVRFFLYTKRSREWCLTRFFLFLCFLRSCIFEVCFFSCSFNGCILYYFLRRGFSCGSSPRGSSSMIFLTVFFRYLPPAVRAFSAAHRSSEQPHRQNADSSANLHRFLYDRCDFLVYFKLLLEGTCGSASPPA